MKTNYILFFTVLLLIGCNKQPNSETADQPVVTKNKKAKEHPEAAFVNQQISNLQYQIEAFKIGKEKVANPELKKYLSDHLQDLETLQSDYKSAAAAHQIDMQPISEELQKDVYKLAIADTKGYDKVFLLYYKDFLSKAMDQIAESKTTEPAFTTLKNKHGNILYEQKLYFDVLK
ncbi:hypothetical protein [Paenimyroides aestuarii]|uniref:Lipoprotein n=1 Tax=Paenimyroides aestuarii TaxID=2968490 RepID=A0ABY5NQJ1_9FLAO|nr:hypothetical protein [Paenimyroides aestuarii]UUV20828.1 hypothetical protein NPX36_10935 [Paenimyroides aestuarii]